MTMYYNLQYVILREYLEQYYIIMALSISSLKMYKPNYLIKITNRLDII